MRVEVELASLPPGSRRLVRAGDVEVAVFNVDGRVYAVNNSCPHRGGPLVRGTLEASPEGPRLRCPMHGWRFLLATGEGVRPGRATVYPVEVCAGGSVIEVVVEGEVKGERRGERGVAAESSREQPLSGTPSPAASSTTFAARGAELVRCLLEAGFDFFTGVPCSLVGPVIAALAPHGYVAETREDAALGLAAGAALAGRRPVVLMQNSGLGVSLNALGSLQAIYALPCLLLVTWRGRDGRDAPEHLVMGRAMPATLDAFEIPWRVLAVESFAADLAWAAAALAERPGPVALVVPPGLFA